MATKTVTKIVTENRRVVTPAKKRNHTVNDSKKVITVKGS